MMLLTQEPDSLTSSTFTIEDSYPLSPLQQGMIFHSLYAENSGVEIEQMVYTMHENVHREALISAWQSVIDRHPILRTGFRCAGVVEPVQQVYAGVSPEWHSEDWRLFSKAEQQERLSSFLENDRFRGFEISEKTLNRFALFQLDENRYQFIWTFHHAILDGHSFVRVLQEVFAFYEASLSGKELQLPRPRPYREYIDWLGEQDFSQARDFWQDLLKGWASPTPLISSHQVATLMTQAQDYGEQDVRLTAEITSELKALAKENGVTLNNFVQGAWALLLSRYSGETDVVFGTTRACRHTAVEGAEHIIGPFINTLPMRINVSQNMPLIQWLKLIRQQHVALRQVEHTPLVKIQEWAEIPPGKSMFESIVVFESYEMGAYLRAQGESWSTREYKLWEQTNYPLTISGWGGETLLLRIAYDRRQFDDQTISRMIGHLKTLIENFAAQPRARLAEFVMLTEAERAQLLVEWNDTQVDYDDRLCIHHLIEAQVERAPDQIAVTYEGEHLTYRQLNSRANQLAHYLHRLGVKREDLIAISMERSPEMIVAMLAVLKAGAAYVPLDATYPQDRLAAMLDDAKPSLVLIHQRGLKKIPPVVGQMFCVDVNHPAIAAESAANPRTPTSANNLAYLIYTSGSTGKPRGVMIEHRSLVNFTEGARRQYEIGEGDRVLQFASFSFDASAEEIYPCLASGATLVLRNEAMLNSISSFLDQCQTWGITILDLPTAYWHELTEQLATTGAALPPSLRLVIIGGERLLPQRLSLWRQQVGSRVRLINTYGPTETTVVVTSCELTDPAHPVADNSIGRPIQNTEAYILDRNLQPVPIGVAGELHIGGAGLARGYLHHNELTATRFIANPFSMQANSRLYKTGDLARFLPDGQIEFCGRVDRQVKVNGFRIELGEIESSLLTHPMVQSVTVLAREDVPGEKRLVAYIVPHMASGFEQRYFDESLRSFLKERLPIFMVPSIFIMLEALPINANGKIDQKALPVPDRQCQSNRREYEKPRNPLQYQLVQIWEELFNIRPIGITDNFFELGGHSLLSVRLMGRIEQAFGKRLELATLFSGATIEHLAAALIEQDSISRRSPLVAVQPNGSNPPFFYLHGDFQGGGMYCLDLARHLGSDQPFYAIQPHGLEGGMIPETIEEMAEDHLKTLRAFQPRGPYQLGGHCNGGLLAFEMARLLEASGEKVNLLVLIATTGANASYQVLQNAINHYCSLHGMQHERQQLFLKTRAMAIRLGEIQRYYADRFKDMGQLSTVKRMALVRQKAFNIVKALGDSNRRREAEGEPLSLKISPGQHSAINETREQLSHRSYERAMLSYVPRKYNGRVTLFWPEEWANQAVNDTTVGWRKVARDVEVHRVPGGHLTCLINHMDALAEELKSCLEVSRRQ